MFGYGNVDKKTKKDAMKVIKGILRLAEIPNLQSEAINVFSIENVENGFVRFPLQALSSENLHSQMHRSYWFDSVDEDDSRYESTFIRFMETEFQPVYELLRKDGKKMQYTYPLNVFEPTLITILNTVQEAKQANGNVLIPKIQERVIEMLSGFVSAIQAVEQNRKEHEERMRLATNQSLLNRLDDEIAYVKNHPLLTMK